MSTAALQPGAAVWQRVRSLLPALAARSWEFEQAGTLPCDVVAQLRQVGLFRLAAPAQLGGSGVTPRTLVEIIEAVCRADGAAGWCVIAANVGSVFSAWLDRDTAKTIATADPGLVWAADQMPAGRAVRVGEDYRLTGRWPLVSGCRHATWFAGGFVVMADGRPVTDRQGVPQVRVAYFPAGQARVLDTAQSVALVGSGSHDVVAEGIRVSAEYTAMPYRAGADYPDPLYRLSAYSLVLVLLSGFSLGVARAALDEAGAQLGTRARPGASQSWLHDPAVQVAVMGQEARLRAARRHVLDTLEEVVADLGEGRCGYPERARLPAAVMHAHDTAAQVVLACFRLAGTRALFDRNPLQRCLRDLMAASQHVALSADCRTAVAGALLGVHSRPWLFGL